MICLLFCDLYTTSFEILVCYDTSCRVGQQISRVRARSTQKRMKEVDINLEYGSGPLSIDWTHGIEKITQHNRTFVRIEWV